MEPNRLYNKARVLFLQTLIGSNYPGGGLPWWLSGKESPAIQEHGLFPLLGRSPGEGNGNPLQDSCLGNPMDRGAWWATVHGVAKEVDMTQQLNNSPRETVLLRLGLGQCLGYSLGFWCPPALGGLDATGRHAGHLPLCSEAE